MSEAKKKKEIHSPKRVGKNLWFLLKYAFRYTPSYVLVTLVEAFGRGGEHIIQVLFMKYLFDAIEVGIDFGVIAIHIAFYIGYSALFELFNKWRLNIYVPKVKLTLHECIQNELYKKAKELDQSCYDDPEFYNDFIWAIRESDARCAQIMENFSIFINRVVSSSVILGVLFTIEPIIGAVLVVTLAVNFIIQYHINRIRFEEQEEFNPINRKLSYVERVFYLPEYAKELRQGDISGHLRNMYGEVTDEKIATTKKYWKRELPLYIISEFLLDIVPTCGATGYLIIRYIIDPTLSLGTFSASLTAMFKLYWTIDDIGNYLNRFNEHSLYIEKVRKFVEYVPKIKGDHEDVPAFEKLEIRNMSFSYPFSKSESKTLTDISLTINRGEKIAFVGYNGAGKTTLTKLLMRLYDVSDGEILYNGVNIGEFAPEKYREHIGAVFQDYKVFAATVGENVMGGKYTENNRETVISALRAASFEDKLDTLSDGLDTVLTKEFDKNGAELSGGEGQKIAIARVFARPYELIIMDEPSSALDPIAEYELNQSILENAADKTVIFISHRLSTTKMADRIYMFADGKIAEYGSHDELMEKGGKYAEMYTVQAKKYRVT